MLGVWHHYTTKISTNQSHTRYYQGNRSNVLYTSCNSKHYATPVHARQNSYHLARAKNRCAHRAVCVHSVEHNMFCSMPYKPHFYFARMMPPKILSWRI